MKKTFFSGLAILLPIAITLLIVFFFINLLTDPFVEIIEETISKFGKEIALKHRYILVSISRIIALIFIFLLTLFLGFLGRRIFFNWFFSLTHKLFLRLPMIKSIYKVTSEVSKNFIEKRQAYFHGTVFVPFPHDNCYAFGLLSGDPPHEITTHEKIRGKNLKSVFVPTSPHPISGFILMYESNEINKTEITGEELIKFLLSFGMAEIKNKQPNDTKNNETSKGS